MVWKGNHNLIKVIYKLINFYFNLIQVVSGELVGLNQGENNKVVVRILRDDAIDAERLKFLQEASPHKVKTKNGNHLVLGLVAACIKMDPLLLVFESSPWVRIFFFYIYT